MRFRILAVAIAAMGVGMVSPAAAEEGFGLPSCIASVIPGAGAPISRLVPPEAKGNLARQVRGVVARAVTWRPGQTIKVCFKSGTRGAQDRVVRVAREWMQYANVVFDFQEGGIPRRCQADGREDVKIDFVDNKGWWSAYGTVSRQRDPSMNLQFLGVDTPRYTNGQPVPELELRRIILHEFGHALGMMHEHQSPNAGCDSEINWEAAYQMGARMGWDKNMVHAQMRQLANAEEYNLTAVDRRSIMHYSLAPEIFTLGRNSKCWVPENNDLSEQDKRFIASIYPKGDHPVVTSSAPSQRPPGAVLTRGAKPPAAILNDKEALIRQYEELLKQAGVAADKIVQMSREFRKSVFGQ
jgi:Astacin (Peptidase family M12A)